MRPGVVVSGIGIVTPLGNGREKTWRALLGGKSAINRGDEGFEARVYDFSANGARSRMGDFAILAAAEAIRHAGLDVDNLRGKNIGCAVSQSKPVIPSKAGIQVSSHLLRNINGLDSRFRVDDEAGIDILLGSFFGWSAESVVQREFGLEGPSANLVAACATGIASIQMGARWVQEGVCDMVLVGAAESSLNEFYRAGFRQMGVLAEEGQARPFDLKRTGFVMGEGAAVMLLESERSARGRGHAPVARLASAVMRQSRSDALRFDPDGGAVAALIGSATQSAGAPGYINAHGTGTWFNDLAETRGIKKSLGAAARDIPVSSTKAATGHLLGAAGAVEAAFAALALRDQRVPPTLNLSTNDPDCDLDYVPRDARAVALTSTMSLSYGFGGQMGAVMFGKIT